MSHLTKITIAIKDLGALGRASDRLGLELHLNKKFFNWYSSNGKCDHAIGLKGTEWLTAQNDDAPYEVGVVQNVDGTFGLQYDKFCGGNGLMEKIGDSAGKLTQIYSLEVARDAAQTYVQQGWNLTEETQENGDIQLKISQAVAGF